MARRGPLLGKVLQHRDDIDAVRSLFLQVQSISQLCSTRFRGHTTTGTKNDNT